MKNITAKYKIWLIITVVILVAGLALFGFLGFNQTPDYKKSYEIQVSVDQNELNAGNIVKDTAYNYLNGQVKVSKYAIQTLDDNSAFILKFNENKEIDTSALKTEIENALNGNEEIKKLNLVISVSDVMEVQTTEYKNFSGLIIALGVAVAVVFVYLLIINKLMSALTTIIVSIISALMYVSLLSLTRIPANPLVNVFTAVSFTLGAVLSAVMLGRFNETKKVVGNEKMSSSDIASLGAFQSVERFIFLFAGLIVASIILIAFGSLYLTFIGLGLIVASVSAMFTAFTLTPTIWAFFTKNK